MTTPKLPTVIDLSPFGHATLGADGVYRADMGGPSVTVTCGPGDLTVTGLGETRLGSPMGEGRKLRRKRERQARSKATNRSKP